MIIFFHDSHILLLLSTHLIFVDNIFYPFQYSLILARCTAQRREYLLKMNDQNLL
jgi:hypothetical protein